MNIEINSIENRITYKLHHTLSFKIKDRASINSPFEGNIKDIDIKNSEYSKTENPTTSRNPSFKAQAP